VCLIAWFAVFGAEGLFQKKSITFKYAGPLIMNVGEENEIELVLQNHSARTVRVVGVNSTCQCVATDALFRAINGHSVEVLKVRIKPTKAGQFRQQILLYFGGTGDSRLLVALDGMAIESA